LKRTVLLRRTLPNRLDGTGDVIGPSPGRSGVFFHPIPKLTERGAPIPILDITADERAHDLTDGSVLLTRKALETGFQVVVDTDGELGHGRPPDFQIIL